MADGVGEEVHHHLQRALELAGGEQGVARRRSVDAQAAAGGADAEQAGGAAGDVGEVDLLRLGAEARPLDRLQIDEIVDQGQQMPARRRDIPGIAGIIGAERSLALAADRLGVGDDPRQRHPQRLVETAAEGARGLGRSFRAVPAVAAGVETGAGADGAEPAAGLDARRGAAEAGETAAAVDQADRVEPVAAAAAAGEARRAGPRTAASRRGR